MPGPILDDISHRRYNPLRGSWVLVSPHRTKRPWQGAQEGASKTTLPEYDPSCYLCPGNKRAQGDQNPKYESTFVFVNDYSAVKEEQAAYKEEDQNGSLSSRLLRAESVTGKCYVITFAPSHNLTLADLTPAQILPVIHTWTQIYTAHLSPYSPLARVAAPTTLPPEGHNTHSIAKPNAQYRYMQIFENKGAAMGCSNPHPHGQIWTTTGMPEEPGLELEQLKKYRREQGGLNLLVDYAQLESEKQERVVFANAAFLAVCPWWATWPFEVMILPRQHKRALVDFSDQERAELAEAMAEVTRRYDNLFETQFPYSMGLHQAPLEGTEAEIEASHFHIHFYPPLLRSATVRKFLVGYEMMAEPQRDITPEQAAARLRDCGGELYRKRMNGGGSEMKGGATETNEGMADTNEGITETNKSIVETNGGVAETKGVMAEATGGKTEMSQPTTETNEGVAETKGVMAEATGGKTEMSQPTTEMKGGVTEANEPTAETEGGTTERKDGIIETDGGMTEVTGGKTEMDKPTTEANEPTAETEEGTSERKEGIIETDGGMTEAAGGKTETNKPTPETKEGTTKMNEGITETNAGIIGTDGGMTEAKGVMTEATGGKTETKEPTMEKEGGENAGTTEKNGEMTETKGVATG